MPTEDLVCLERVGGLVECLVEGHREVTGCGHHQGEDALIDPPIGLQDIEQDTHRNGGTARERADGAEIGDHDTPIVVVQDEVAASRAHHELHADPLHGRQDGRDEPGARGGPADAEVGAQLDSIGAGTLGSDDARQIVDADLDQRDAPGPMGARHGAGSRATSVCSSCAIRPLPAPRPPSTGRQIPVIQRAASEARKATASATSSGSPMRRSGYQRPTVSRTLGSAAILPSQEAVRMEPGATAWHRIPRGTVLDGDRAGELDQPGPGCGVGFVAVMGQAVDGCDVDDAPAAAAEHAGQHAPGESQGHGQGRLDVDPQVPVAGAMESHRGQGRGVVDEQVDVDAVERLIEGIGDGGVETRHQRARKVPGDRVGVLSGPFKDDDPVAAPVEPSRRRYRPRLR